MPTEPVKVLNLPAGHSPSHVSSLSVLKRPAAQRTPLTSAPASLTEWAHGREGQSGVHVADANEAIELLTEAANIGYMHDPAADP